MNSSDIKLIMPMAGLGTRFSERYAMPKPLVDAGGLPLFVRSVECIRVEFSQKIFLTAYQHQLTPKILEYYPDATVIEIDETTQGTACTLQYAREYWQDGSSIFIANCDQAVDYDPEVFYNIRNEGYDGSIAVFECPERDPKWSYALCDSDMNVSRVAEKDPISEWATVGYYYYKDGRVFESAVDKMIRENDRVNNEFYTCPAYNHTVDRKIKAYEVTHMQGLGTPEDLDVFHSTQGQYDWPTTNF